MPTQITSFLAFEHPEKDILMNGGQVLAGIGMMVGAVVWFVVGYLAGYIFFYPPILLIIGLVTMVKGLMGREST